MASKSQISFNRTQIEKNHECTRRNAKSQDVESRSVCGREDGEPLIKFVMVRHGEVCDAVGRQGADLAKGEPSCPENDQGVCTPPPVKQLD